MQVFKNIKEINVEYYLLSLIVNSQTPFSFERDGFSNNNNNKSEKFDIMFYFFM